jgi:glyoxylase-like metal-dependent hydrolase (beta-lactamase superfamily II)
MALAAPVLHLPESSSTVSVSVIDTTSNIFCPTSVVVTPHINGHDNFDCPCFSFLVTHKESGKKILFDLGIRKDPENFSPATAKFAGHLKASAEKNVADLLGVGASQISAIIWSHHHFDHIGDPSTFPKSTAVVVGGGFKAEFLPGYPAREDSWILESDYEGRELREIDFKESDLKLGQFDAFDYFGDGSFYLVDCPGHTIGHMMGLARTTSTTFILMGADCSHHGGEIRPTEYLPLPETIDPDILINSKSYTRRRPCPGSLFQDIHPKKSRTEPFYELPNPKNADTVHEAIRSQRKMREFDANENVLVLVAHDADASSVINMWPQTVDDWKSQGWKQKLTWAFLKDFHVD